MHCAGNRDHHATGEPAPAIPRAAWQAGQLDGDVIRPGDVDYEAARRVWNAAIDREPSLIVRPRGTTDITRTLAFAQANGLPLAIRGGGHSPGGYGTIDNGVVVDMSRMNAVHIDPDRRAARVQAGATWGEFIAASQAHGLATPGADVAAVGVAGATLAGGMGWLMRRHGLTIDNLVSVDIVTADGRTLTASDTEHPDLFWALRGGGGNFGVATAFDFRLHPVGTVLGGALVYPATRDGLRAYAEAVVTAPDELTTITFLGSAPPLPFIPAHAHGTPVHLIMPCYCGDLDRGDGVLRPLRRLAGLTPLADTIGPMPYTELYRATDSAAISRPHAARNCYLRELTDEVIDVLIDFVGRATSPFGVVALRELGAAVSRVPVGATAFAHRDKSFYLAVDNAWEDTESADRHLDWTEALWRALAPHAAGAYSGYLSEEGEQRLLAAYPPRTLSELRTVKRSYDPRNIFRSNPNIAPGQAIT